MSRVKTNPLELKMKKLEKKACHNIITNRQPFIIRLDGVNFSKWTRILENKHDPRLPLIFELTLTPLFKKLNNLRLIYQQSDEVNMLFSPPRPNSQHAYGGKTYKLLSIIPSMLSVNFTKNAEEILGVHRPAYFDARIIIPNNKEDIIDYFTWRYSYSIRNSINSYAHEVGYSKRIQHMTKWEVVEFLKQQGYDWFQLPETVRYGFFLVRDYTENNIEKIIITDKTWKDAIIKLIDRATMVVPV